MNSPAHDDVADQGNRSDKSDGDRRDPNSDAPKKYFPDITHRQFSIETIGRPIQFTAWGEPASKANSRELVTIRGVLVPIKSKKARGYAVDFLKQCPCLDELLTGDLYVAMTVHYASRRPDLDESLILDLMQKRIYANDRQVKRKWIEWALDPAEPRVFIEVGKLAQPLRTAKWL